MWDWMIGLAGSVGIASLAYAKGSLSVSGAIGAVGVGTVLYAAGDAYWFTLMILFFVTSSLLTKWKRHRKSGAEAVYEKTGRRDWGQVAANGGIGVLLCIGHALWPHPAWISAYAGVMASVTADTWATEIGGLSPKQPRSILTGKVVPAGTSGGVTLYGLTAAGCGSLLMGAAGWLLLTVVDKPGPGSLWLNTPGRALWFIGCICLCGFASACVDSWIGARWQAMFRCVVCGRDVEKSSHCGREAASLRGHSWMNNDAVNVISSLIGSVLAVVLSWGIF